MINQVVITGRLVKDPELKQTTNGTNVCSFLIANDTGFGDNKRTNFITIVTWKQQAELVAKYFRKGSMICIVGELRYRDYKGTNGKQSTVEISATKVDFIEKKQSTPASVSADTTSFSTPNDDFEEIGGNDDLPF